MATKAVKKAQKKTPKARKPSTDIVMLFQCCTMAPEALKLYMGAMKKAKIPIIRVLCRAADDAQHILYCCSVKDARAAKKAIAAVAEQAEAINFQAEMARRMKGFADMMSAIRTGMMGQMPDQDPKAPKAKFTAKDEEWLRNMANAVPLDIQSENPGSGNNSESSAVAGFRFKGRNVGIVMGSTR